MTPLILQFFLAMLTGFLLVTGISVKADDSRPLRLPQGKTFEDLATQLAELNTAAFSQAAAPEIQKAEQLILKGRLYIDAGRLKQAGFVADRVSLTLKVIALLIKNAELKQELITADRLLHLRRQESSEIKKRLADITAAASTTRPQTTPTDTEYSGVGAVP